MYSYQLFFDSVKRKSNLWQWHLQTWWFQQCSLNAFGWAADDCRWERSWICRHFTPVRATLRRIHNPIHCIRTVHSQNVVVLMYALECYKYQDAKATYSIQTRGKLLLKMIHDKCHHKMNTMLKKFSDLKLGCVKNDPHIVLFILP